jgi:hypothetical protein
VLRLRKEYGLFRATSDTASRTRSDSPTESLDSRYRGNRFSLTRKPGSDQPSTLAVKPRETEWQTGQFHSTGTHPFFRAVPQTALLCCIISPSARNASALCKIFRAVYKRCVLDRQTLCPPSDLRACLDVGVEDADFLPVGLVFFDELFVSRVVLVTVMGRLVLENDVQGHVKITVVDGAV